MLVKGFGASAIDYIAQFWIERLRASIATARDQVRTNLWYTFRRRNIEIPYPIQIQYERDEEPLRTDRHVRSAAERLGAVDLFATLSARGPPSRWRASATSICSPPANRSCGRAPTGDSMFVRAERPRARVLEPSGQEVAVIPAGGFFGEMSMLTGDRAHAPRSRRSTTWWCWKFQPPISASSRWRIRPCSITSRRSSAHAAPVSKTRGRTRQRSPRRKRSRPSWRGCASFLHSDSSFVFASSFDSTQPR